MEAPSSHNGQVVLMSSEGHVAGVHHWLSPLDPKEQQRDIVIPTFDRAAATGSLACYRHHRMALTVAL